MKNTESLCENYLFRRLYARGKSYLSPYFVLYCMKNRKNCNRLGITTGKKIGCAVRRNRARRLLKEAYRLSEHRLCSGCDFVIVARSRALGANSGELAEELAAGMEKLGCLVKQDAAPESRK